MNLVEQFVILGEEKKKIIANFPEQWRNELRLLEVEVQIENLRLMSRLVDAIENQS